MNRCIIVLLTHSIAASDTSTAELLCRLAPHASELIAVVGPDTKVDPSRLADVDAHVATRLRATAGGFASAVLAVQAHLGGDHLARFDEVVVLSDELFGLLPGTEFPHKPTMPGVQLWTLVEPDREAGPERVEMPFLGLEPGLFAAPEFLEDIEVALGERFDSFVAHLRKRRYAVSAVHRRQNNREKYFSRDRLLHLLDEGLAFLPWKLFTGDPLVFDRWGIVPSEVYRRIVTAGYPAQELWCRILLDVPPRVWYTNLSMSEVITPKEAANAPTQLTTAVLMHVFYVDMLDDLLDLAAKIPGKVDVVITTNTSEKQQEIELATQYPNEFASIDVRVVTTNNGRDISAFLVDCGDILRDPAYDLIVKLHSKRSVQDPPSVSHWFRRHLFENLFDSAAHTREVYRLFEDEPLLGMVFPPTIHMGLPTLGHAWGLNLGPATALAQRLGITVPFDRTTPISPYGSMFIARREALTPLLDANFDVSEFPSAAEYHDGSLAHVLERLVSYGAFSRGFYAKTVEAPHMAAISQTVMEYKLQAVGEYLQSHAIDQVETLAGRGESWPVNQAIERRVISQTNARIPGLGNMLAKGMTGVKLIKRIVRRK